MTTNNGLPAATLAIDATLALPAIYLLFKHGLRHGAVIGWAYLFIFFSLKIVASAMQVSNPSNTTASLIASIGLSPLLLAALGILHEARAYCIPNRNRFFDLVWVVCLHFVVTAAIALTAAGASGLTKPDTTPDKRKSDLGIVKGGMIVLLLTWICLIVLSIMSAISSRGRTSASEPLPYHRQGRWLLNAVLLSIPFIGIRLIVSLVYFTTLNPDLNPATGAIGVRVGLNFIEELIITIGFVVAGIVTRNIGADEHLRQQTQGVDMGH
ncbi:hypothetical protein BX600DRAFT_441620 [Xylariales sp. PMI_506]|nr:hypothetical protein BX600DRAFT_441620 [Xylariales sp. PMI_506]